MPRVLITPDYLREAEGPFRRILKEAGFELVFPPTDVSLKQPDNLIRQLDGIEAVLASVEPYSREVLTAARLRVIARSGVGYDSIDLEAAADRDVLVTNTPGANKEGVAEHTLALLLAVAHGFPARDLNIRAGRWVRGPLPRAAGRMLGVVGLGAIGKEVARRGAALGMYVIAHDPAADTRFAQAHDVRLRTFDQLLAEADFVSLHLPCTPQTTHLIDAAALARMKPGAMLINTARGGLVDEAALVGALADGRLAAAALDVFQREPLPADHPLTRLDNVLLCPHMGGLDRESLQTMARLAAASIVALHRGGWPEGRVVDARRRGTWRW